MLKKSYENWYTYISGQDSVSCVNCSKFSCIPVQLLERYVSTIQYSGPFFFVTENVTDGSSPRRQSLSFQRIPFFFTSVLKVLNQLSIKITSDIMLRSTGQTIKVVPVLWFINHVNSSD